jgi:hypothetical protein
MTPAQIAEAQKRRKSGSRRKKKAGLLAILRLIAGEQFGC